MRPLSEAAREWLSANVDVDAQYFGDALVVEHRYVGDLVGGMLSDGLELQWTGAVAPAV